MRIKVFDSKTLKNIIEINLALVTKVKNECIIGRSPESGIVLDSPDVSRMHGKLLLENGNYYFYDLGSKNGSLINGKIAETNHKYLLNVGDTIRLGEFLLTLEEVNTQPENIAETVYRSFDATVVASLRDSTDLNQPNQPPEVEPVPQVVNNILEAVTSYQEVTKVQTEEISVAQGTEVSEDVIVTPAETPQVVEAVNQPIQIIEVAENLDNISPINEPEEITLTHKPSPELNLSQENEVANDVEIPEVSPTTSENIAATTKETVESNIELNLTDIQEAEIVEEEITTATTPIIIEVEQALEETTIQPREETPSAANIDVFSSEQDNEISEAIEIEPTSSIHIESSEIKEEETADREQPELISTKYIALLAHDSKKFELAQFVTKHQDFFSQCLTVAAPSVSEILSSQAGIHVTDQTAAPTSGGYQAIAAKVASGDILAVLFLRDFLQPQSSAANEEAMLRVCNINQVMVATNLPTAEAIVGYLQSLEKLPSIH